MKKALFYLITFILLLVGGFVVFVMTSWEVKHEVPYPEIAASVDSTVIARGKYLAFGPAHCATCHVPMDQIAAVEGGLEIPLSGGWELSIPPGTFRAPNLTPDEETGIGRFTDGELARALRHSVKHDGSVMFPLMPFQEISDADLTAIISFLRSQPAVRHEVEPSSYTFLGKMLMATACCYLKGLNIPLLRLCL